MSSSRRRSAVVALLRWSILAAVAVVLACGGIVDRPAPGPLPGPFADCARGDASKLHVTLTCTARVGSRAVAVFGYTNDAADTTIVPHGPENELAPTLADPYHIARPWDGLGTPKPPTAFAPGAHRDGLVVAYDTEMRWKLGTSEAKTSDSAETCTTETSGGRTWVVLPTTGEKIQVALGASNANAASIEPTQAPLNGATVGEVPAEFTATEDGAATVVVPLWVPDGRAGMQPSLSLRYHSRQANGILGVGWMLSGLSQIGRCHQTELTNGNAAPLSFDPSDRLCLDGDVLVEHDASKLEFRPQHDPFTRVRIDGVDDQGPKGFTVERRDGRIYHYGTAGARLEGRRLIPDAASAGYAKDDTESPLGRMSWFLDEVRDRAGNAIRYRYEQADSSPGQCGSAGACVAHELRPKQVSYTHFGASGPATRVVTFLYEPRSDNELVFAAGFPIWHPDRLSAIEVFAGAPGQTLERVRRYSLHYEMSPLSERSLLRRILECDGHGVCKPARTFDYEPGDPGFERGETLTNGPLDAYLPDPSDSGRRLPHTNLVVADFDGDGRDDILYRAILSGAWKIRFGNGTSFTPPEDVNLAPFTGAPGQVANGREPMPVAVDWNVDGKVDIAWPALRKLRVALCSICDPIRYHEDYGSVYDLYTWNAETRRFDPLPGAPPGEGYPGLIQPVAFGDLDGDGRPDRLRGGSILFQKPGTGGAGVSVTAPLLIAQMPAVSASALVEASGRYDWSRFTVEELPPTCPGPGCKPTFRHVARVGQTPLATTGFAYTLFDVNGDGLADAVTQKLDSTNLGLALNTGGGFKVSEFSVPEFSATARSQERRGIIPLDYRESGRPDLYLIVGSYSERAALLRFDSISTSNRAPQYMPRILAVPDLPFVNAHDRRDQLLAHTNILDANGDGLDDVLVPEGNPGRLTLFVRKGKKADHLTVIRNGFGDETRIRYTALQASPSGCAYPVRCGARGLWVVAGWEHHAQEASARRQFSVAYTRPASDLQGGGFLGFQERWVKDHQTGDETTTRFDRHTEKVNGTYPFVRVPTSVTTKSGVAGGSRETSVSYEYELSAVPSEAGEGLTSVVARARRIVDRVTETRSGKVEVLREFETTLEDYDAYGNVGHRTVRAKLAGVVDEVRTRYRNDTDRWLLGLEERVDVTSTVAALTVFAPDRARKVRSSAYDYDSNTGLVTSVTYDPEGDTSSRLVTRLERNAYGQVVASVASDLHGRTRRTDIAWDEAGIYPRAVSNAVGHVERMVYHAGLGVVLEEEDANGVIQRRTYDRFGRLRRVLPPQCSKVSCPKLAAEMEVSYESAGPGLAFGVRITSVGAPGSFVAYDALGRKKFAQWTAFDGTGKVSYEYDRAFVDRVTSEIYLTGASGGGGLSSALLSVGRKFDNIGRIVQVSDPKHGTTKLTYEGLITRSTDAVGATSYAVYDELGRVVRSVNVSGVTLSVLPGFPPRVGLVPEEVATSYVYGPFGELIQVSDAQRNLTNLYYDVRGRRVALDDPDSGRTVFEHDAFGSLVRKVDAKGRETTFGYDAMGRRVARKSPDGLGCWGWDEGLGASGRLSSSRFIPADGDEVVVQSIEYDGYGRPTADYQQVGSGTRLSTSGNYDEFGRIARITHPDGFSVNHLYTSAGYLRSLTTADGALLWQEMKQDLVGRTEWEISGDGYATVRSYHPFTGLPREASTWSLTRGDLQRFNYTWYPDGNLKTRRDHALAGAPLESFEYDRLNRLTSWKGSNGFAVAYAYDAIGNLLSRQSVGVDGAKTGETFTPGPSGPGSAPGLPPHAIVESDEGKYEYDETGDQTVAPGRTVSWTSFHLPKRIEATGEIVRYAYDAQGNRVRRTSETTGETVTYFGAYEERRLGPAVTRIVSIENGRGVVAQLQTSVLRDDTTTSSGRLLFLHGDHLGSPTVVTDREGKLVERRHFEPFGRLVDAVDPTKPAGTTGSVRLGFTGHEHEDSIGLINMRGRIYDPKVGRFLSADPIVASPYLGQALNRYSYVLNNPLNLVDPTGLSFSDVGGGGAGSNSGGGMPIHIQLGGGRADDGADNGCGGCIDPSTTIAPCPPPNTQLPKLDVPPVSENTTTRPGAPVPPDLLQQNGYASWYDFEQEQRAKWATWSPDYAREMREHNRNVVHAIQHALVPVEIIVPWVNAASALLGMTVAETTSDYALELAAVVPFGKALKLLRGELKVIRGLLRASQPLSREARDTLRLAAREVWLKRMGYEAADVGLDVHHRIPLEWAHLFPKMNPNAVENLIGVAKHEHSRITAYWNTWRNSLGGRTPTQQEIEGVAKMIDGAFARAMVRIK